MSREIKFRAFIKHLQIMVKIESVDFITKMVEVDLTGGEGDTTWFTFENVELVQYTSLKDKNGREVYEGDIIYWEINNGVGIESYTAIVKWSENLVEEGWSQTYKWLVGYTGNYYRGSYDELSTPAAYNDALQIMGNIYENPELMEGTA